jgi:hypothetical protein
MRANGGGWPAPASSWSQALPADQHAVGAAGQPGTYRGDLVAQVDHTALEAVAVGGDQPLRFDLLEAV